MSKQLNQLIGLLKQEHENVILPLICDTLPANLMPPTNYPLYYEQCIEHTLPSLQARAQAFHCYCMDVVTYVAEAYWANGLRDFLLGLPVAYPFASQPDPRDSAQYRALRQKAEDSYFNDLLPQCSSSQKQQLKKFASSLGDFAHKLYVVTYVCGYIHGNLLPPACQQVKPETADALSKLLADAIT